MRSNATVTVLCATLLVGATMATCLQAAPTKQSPPPPAPLSERGEKLLEKYTTTLEEFRQKITDSLPRVDAKEQEAFTAVYQAEAEASKAELDALRGQKKKPEAYEPAKQALEKAKAAAEAPASAMLAKLQSFLASDSLDKALVEAVVLIQATPRGLAEFTEQGDSGKKLIDQLLADPGLMKEMVIAGGAREGKYGQAMTIYTDILKASPKAQNGVLNRLAMAVSLEHAVPIAQTNPDAKTDAPSTVDPLKRYRHFEKAFLDGELDPGFEQLSIWDLRMVVNGDEPDETLAWGRQMLRNYRPDIIATPDHRWRYVQAVKTDVRYGSQDNKYDRPDLQKYQNILMNGGVCGRRAFFGRFILRSFGIPTTARPQQGHAALVHWTPEGWVVNLGASWTWGWTEFGQDRDFLVFTQARMAGDDFVQVERAKWIGTVLGESDAFGFHATPSGFWNGIALSMQRKIVAQAQAKTLEAVGQDIAEANESREKDVVQATPVTDADRTIVVGKDGAITVPAVACSKPTQSTAKIIFMPSQLGGLQVHYGRNGEPETFEYTVNAPAAGIYTLTARVVTTSHQQHLKVTANGGTEPVDIALPFTTGMWDETPAVKIPLVEGSNVLVVAHSSEGAEKGVTIKDFTLTPVE